MDSTFDTLKRLLPTLLLLWLPIEDSTIKSVLSYPLSDFLINIIRGIINWLSKYSHLIPFINFYRKNYIKINKGMIQYDNLLIYISENYSKNIVGYTANSDAENEIKYDIDEINSMYLNDIFEHKGKKYNIFLQTTKNTNENGNKKSFTTNEIYIKGNCSTTILKKYIEDIHYLINERLTTKQNALKIFRMNFDETKGKDKKKKIQFQGWKKYICLTNKTIKNTILSKSVKVGFLDALEEFINSPEKYKIRGMPYKIGFALYGEPGCGKTSIVKAIAHHYNIPIFIINLDVIKNNDTLVKVTNMISSCVISGKLHILLFEDIDRCKLFNNNYYDEKNISMNTLLNVLDGVDETHGRINILSANNLSKLLTDKALCRPGRIDKVIHLTHCCNDQIMKIIDIFFPGEGHKCKGLLVKDIIVTPATLTQIIITLNDPIKIIKFLNQHQNFKKWNVIHYLITWLNILIIKLVIFMRTMTTMKMTILMKFMVVMKAKIMIMIMMMTNKLIARKKVLP